MDNIEYHSLSTKLVSVLVAFPNAMQKQISITSLSAHASTCMSGMTTGLLPYADLVGPSSDTIEILLR